MSLERIESTEGLDYYDLTGHIVECYQEIDRLEKNIKLIQSILNGEPWTPTTLDEIADILRNQGLKVEDVE